MSKVKIKEKVKPQIDLFNLAIVIIATLAIICVLAGTVVIIKFVLDSNMLHLR